MSQVSVGDRVIVVGGPHEGLCGVLYSVNTKGVSFIYIDGAYDSVAADLAVDGVLKAVKTIYVAPASK